MIETERLVLRAWCDADRAPFAAMGADPEVMRHLAGTIDREASDTIIDRLEAEQVSKGHTFWAIERRADKQFLGFCGLRIGGHEGTPVIDELEIGWRLRRDAWGLGLAREAAEASLAWGWRALSNDRISAWTVEANSASWGLMQRLGMIRMPALDFDHPRLPEDSPLRRHIVYSIARPV